MLSHTSYAMKSHVKSNVCRTYTQSYCYLGGKLAGKTMFQQIEEDAEHRQLTVRKTMQEERLTFLETKENKNKTNTTSCI